MIARAFKFPPFGTLLALLTLLALPLFAIRPAFADTEEHGDKNGQEKSDDSLVPRLNHVIVVIMENKSYEQTLRAPYTASLIAGGALFTASTATHHPSLPNYLAIWSGSAQGVKDNTCPAPGSPFQAENLGHACEAAGLTWRAYSEDLPAAGSMVCTNNGTRYTRKHDPWTYFGNLNHTNERPYADLANDIAAARLPTLAFVVPNNCDNSHDNGPCNVTAADQWLANNLPAMLTAVGRHGVVILTWDEDDNVSGNHILTVMSGPPVKPGVQSSRPITHYTVLRTICEVLDLKAFGAAAGEAPISDIWRQDLDDQESRSRQRRSHK
jgi:hypothetical protein